MSPYLRLLLLPLFFRPNSNGASRRLRIAHIIHSPLKCSSFCPYYHSLSSFYSALYLHQHRLSAPTSPLSFLSYGCVGVWWLQGSIRWFGGRVRLRMVWYGVISVRPPFPYSFFLFSMIWDLMGLNSDEDSSGLLFRSSSSVSFMGDGTGTYWFSKAYYTPCDNTISIV